MKRLISMILVVVMMFGNTYAATETDETFAESMADQLMLQSKTAELEKLLTLMDEIDDVEGFVEVYTNAFGLIISEYSAEKLGRTIMLYYNVVGAESLGDRDGIVTKLLAEAESGRSLEAVLGLDEKAVALGVENLDDLFIIMTNSIIAIQLGKDKMMLKTDESHDIMSVDAARASALIESASAVVDLAITDKKPVLANMKAMTEYYNGLTDSEKVALYQYLSDHGFVEVVVPVMPLNGSGELASKTTVIDDEAVVRAVPKFTDLDLAPWAREGIRALYQFGVINGKSESIYDPEGKITRAEFAAFIVRILGLEGSGAKAFDDVLVSEWYFTEVNICAENGYIKGVGNGMYEPTALVTREEVATVLGRVMVDKGLDVMDEAAVVELLNRVQDQAAIEDWARQGTAQIYANYIQVSTESAVDLFSTRFYPDRSATRAEVSEMLYRLAKVVETVIVFKE